MKFLLFSIYTFIRIFYGLCKKFIQEKDIIIYAYQTEGFENRL